MTSRRGAISASVALTGIAVVGFASIAASPAGAVGPGSKTPAATATPGTIFVLNAGPSSITSYPRFASGGSAPLTTIRGPRAGLTGATDLVVTSTGMLWVTVPTTNALQEYAAGAAGNVRPVRRIAGAKTKLHSPVALALDRKGDLWVLNDNISDSSASLVEFRPGSAGNVPPARRISGRATRLFPAGGIAASPDGKYIWVTHVEAGSGMNSPGLQRFSTSAAGNTVPTATIAGARTLLDYPSSLVLDRTGALTVASDPDRRKPSALVSFAPAAVGNIAPARTITGRATTLNSPAFVALDAKARVWAPNPGGSRLARFAAAAAGNAAPTRTIVGKATGLANPRAVAVLTAVPGAPRGLTVTHVGAGRLQISWRPPASTGGGLEGYHLYRRMGAAGVLHRTGLGVVRSVTTRPLAGHHRYTFFLRADNDVGASPASASVVATVH